TGKVAMRYPSYVKVNRIVDREVLEVYNAEDYTRLRKMVDMILDDTNMLSDRLTARYHTTESLKRTLNLKNSYFYELIRNLRQHGLLAVVHVMNERRYIINPFYASVGPVEDSVIRKLFSGIEFQNGLPKLELK